MQEQENKIVMDEFNSIDDSNATVYKLTGPVLVPQTKGEASMNVEKRLEFIRAEMYVQSFASHKSQLTRPANVSRPTLVSSNKVPKKSETR